MRASAFKPIRAGLAAAAALAVVLAADAARAQGAADAAQAEIVSSEIVISRSAAELRLELAGGRELRFAIRDERVLANGDELGRVRRGGDLDRAWRDLLNRAMDAPSAELPALLTGWQAPPGEVGERLDRTLESALGAGAAVPAPPLAAEQEDVGGSSDTVAELNARIAELERELDEAAEVRTVTRPRMTRPWYWPLRHIGHGLSNIISTLVLYAVLVGLGFGLVFFGGRRYLEGVADTARRATLRSGLVGLAGSFLVLPAFILGTIALAISIVGIPLLLAWLPLFPVAFAVALLFGYLAVAHAAGEGLAERRLHGGEWFRRANSYYYLLTGVGLLLVLFIAAHIMEMGSPWLGLLEGLFTFLAVALTWAAATVGFGAVLLSRAGTRPLAPAPAEEPQVEPDDALQEEPHV